MLPPAPWQRVSVVEPTVTLADLPELVFLPPDWTGR